MAQNSENPNTFVEDITLQEVYKILKTLARNEVLMFHFLLIVDLLFQVFLTLINFMVYQTIKTLISEMQNR